MPEQQHQVSARKWQREFNDGLFRVELESIGEGYNGDFDPSDPDDVELLRFSVDQRETLDDDWTGVENSSYCTELPVDIDDTIAEKALTHIINVAGDALREGTHKRLCGELSWISVNSLTEQ
tara:strand:+ start:833 stop:1198 length:366 start_codon:yes stop_codon:yes gene_type:complete